MATATIGQLTELSSGTSITSAYTEIEYSGTSYKANAGAGIIEYGSSSDGSWVKYSDGTMQQWNSSSTTSWAATAAYGANYIGAKTFTYPVAWYSAPTLIPGYVQFATGASWSCAPVSTSLTNFDLRGMDISSRATGLTVYYSWYAIGRWKA